MEIVEGELVEDDDNGIIDAMEIIANTPDDDVVNLDAVEEPPF